MQEAPWVHRRAPWVAARAGAVPGYPGWRIGPWPPVGFGAQGRLQASKGGSAWGSSAGRPRGRSAGAVSSTLFQVPSSCPRSLATKHSQIPAGLGCYLSQDALRQVKTPIPSWPGICWTPGPSSPSTVRLLSKREQVLSWRSLLGRAGSRAWQPGPALGRALLGSPGVSWVGVARSGATRQ